MKKNRKNDRRSLIEKGAEKQVVVLIVWMMLVLIVIASSGILAFLAFKFLLPDYVLIGKISVSSICLISFLVAIYKTIKDSLVTIPENHFVLLECFDKFVGKMDDAPQESRGVIKSGLHLIFPYFKIFKIHNNIAYFLGDMGIELFKNVNKKNEFPVNLKDTAVNLSVVVIVKIFNPILTAYNVSDYQSLLVKKCEAAIIRKANKYNLATLLESRELLSLDCVFPKSDSGEKNLEIKKFEEEMGVKLLEIVIVDIGVQQKDQEHKTKIFQAENEQKAAAIENQILIEREKTKAELLAIKTAADQGRIEGLSDANASNIKKTKKAEGEAIKEFKKDTDFDNKEVITKDALEAIKDSDKLLIGGKGGASAIGSEMAFGAGFVKGDKKTEEKEE